MPNVSAILVDSDPVACYFAGSAITCRRSATTHGLKMGNVLVTLNANERYVSKGNNTDKN